MRIACFPEHEVPTELRAQVLRLQQQAWPADEPLEVGPVHDPLLQPISMLLLDGERVCSALDILSKTILVDGREWAASGLSTVVTDEELRGRGYGRRLVRAARDQIAASGADVGLFTCDASLSRLYESAGWELLPGTVLVGGTESAPFPSDQFDKVAFGAFFTAAAARARGAFVGSRIPLYPGTIDRLW
ncbi:MAG TPA: GNAT family N-acetyltransferase [Gaiellaceae bacterium]|nr:GNAT family N-acetyltransferase [Gaiellaceae bacterium]